MTTPDVTQSSTKPKARSPRMTALIHHAAAADLAETALPAAPPSRTPTALRRLQWIGAGVVVIVGGLTVLGSGQIVAELHATPEPTASYIQISTIRSDVLAAGNLVAREQLGSNDATIARVNATVDHAATMVLAHAAADPSSRPQLAVINRQLNSYSQQLQVALSTSDSRTARAALASADAIYDRQLGPSLTAAENAALVSSISFKANVWFWVSVAVQVAGAATLVWASVATARLTHRYVNIGLVSGLAATVALIIASSVVFSTATSATSAAHSSTVASAYTISRVQQLTALTDRIQLRGVLDHTWPVARSVQALNNSAEARALGLKRPASAINSSIVKLTNQQDALTARLDSAEWAVAKAAVAGTRTALTTDLTSMNASSAGAMSSLSDSTDQQRQETTIGLVLVTVLQGLIAAVGALAIGWSFDRRLREYR